MKVERVEILVELPEHIAAEWEVVAVRRAMAGDFVPLATLNGVTVIEMASEKTGLHAILRRKCNPRDWWPQWVLADTLTFVKNGSVGLGSRNGEVTFVHPDTQLMDFSSWLPAHLLGSDLTIKNPWKTEVNT